VGPTRPGRPVLIVITWETSRSLRVSLAGRDGAAERPVLWAGDKQRHCGRRDLGGPVLLVVHRLPPFVTI